MNDKQHSPLQTGMARPFWKCTATAYYWNLNRPKKLL